MPASHPRPSYHIYCDESSQNGCKFMVFGAISIESNLQPAFKVTMDQWRTSRGMNHEIKWIKVHRSRLDETESLLSQWMWLARDKSIFRFRALALDATKIDYRTFHDGDRELGFYKFFYHFLLHSFGGLVKRDSASLHIRFDQRDSRYKLHTIKHILNNGFRKDYGCDSDVVLSVEAVDSHVADLIQIADVFMGAIAFEYNGLHLRPDARDAKVALCKRIAEMVGATSLTEKISKPHFSVWPFELEKQKRPKP